MTMTTPTTRRTALGRIGLALAGAVGFGAGGAGAVRAAHPAPEGDARGVLTLHARALRTVPGLRDPRSATRLEVDPFGELLDQRHRPVGSFATTTVGPGGSLHTFTMPDGMLLGLGAGGFEHTAHAVVGGTGRFAGASGSYTILPAPELPGRSLTFAFTLTLPTPEA